MPPLVLNGDGDSWIKEPYDPEDIFQLDWYHVYKEISNVRSVINRRRRWARDCLMKRNRMRCLSISVYMQQVWIVGMKRTAKVKKHKLYKYLSKSRDGLLPYNKRGGKNRYRRQRVGSYTRAWECRKIRIVQ